MTERVVPRMTATFGATLMLLSVTNDPAAAQLGPDGSPIETSSYKVDLTRGSVISTSRVTGLAGAATAIAEGVEGGLQNPAAVAWRGPQWPDWYDYWLAFAIVYPFDTGDFYNSGRVVDSPDANLNENFLFFIPGAYWQMWNFGIGLVIDSQRIIVDDVVNPMTGETDTLRLRFTTFHIQIGYGFLDGQLMLATGVRILRERILLGDEVLGKDDEAFVALGVGTEVGFMYRPHGKRYRVGASFYPRIGTGAQRRGRATEENGNVVIDGIFLPDSSELPHTGSFGFAYQAGPRPPNPAWTSIEEFAAPELERLDRRKASVEAAEKREVAATRERGGPDVELCVAQVKARYEKKYEQIEQWRKDIKYQAWKTLRDRYRHQWSRWYFLVTADLEITGKVKNGVGVESFIFQTVQRSGEDITFSPRLGVEGEIWPKRMKARAGTYLEPSRFANTDDRWHATFGFDVRVVKWSVFGLWPEDYQWQLSFALDFARNYSAISAGIGGWY